ncbi:hypothetical protein E3J59_00465 [Candidatus Aerophobetes bacterium]|uniref:PepSY domain-containing protein n=1 Tax=Aerophobetes bacterium TaxID=2030807 RepID=A0A523V191_UNCAE|nr:MAG: hypothetical protein E3J59_00465 [Candidatus Aerophobetes bacterium]
MKKIWITITIVAGSILIAGLWFVPGLAGAHTNLGGMMGTGMMGRGMMGYGMMGQEQNMFEECEEMMEGVTDGKQQAGEALTQEDAVSIVEGYLKKINNPNLKVGEVEQTADEDYLVEIVTKDGSLVDKLEVNRLSGWIHSIYAE